MASTETLVPLFRETVELCNLKRSETLLICLTPTPRPITRRWRGAGNWREAFHVEVPTTVPETDHGVIAKSGRKSIWSSIW